MLAVGALVVIAVNVVLLRRVFGPLERLTALMRRVDPLAPGRRIELERAGGRGRASSTDVVQRDARPARARAADERPAGADGAGARAAAARARAARRGRADADRRRPPARGAAPGGAGGAGRAGRAAAGDRPRGSRGGARDRRAGCGPRRSTSSGCAARSISLADGRHRARPACACGRGSTPELPRAGARAGPRDLPRRAGEPDQRRPPRRRRDGRRSRSRAAATASCCGCATTAAASPPEAAGPGSGLAGMRERALLVGGRLDVRRHGEGGTEVRLDVPLDGRA